MQKKIKPDLTRPRVSKGSKYYIIDRPGDRKGSINIVDVIETGHPMDLRFWESGNYFLSKEEAEVERDRLESIGKFKTLFDLWMQVPHNVRHRINTNEYKTKGMLERVMRDAIKRYVINKTK